MKECKRCHRQLPETEFYKNISAKDGLQSWCKSCINDYDKNVRPFKEKNKNGGGAGIPRFRRSPLASLSTSCVSGGIREN